MASQPTPDRKCDCSRQWNADLAMASAVPFVLIGHSKLFARANEWALHPFLNRASARQDGFCFDTLQGISEIVCR